jgi:hypothetical protein
MIARRRGRILRVVPGYNPNSSSLGVDVSFLLFGTVAVTAATLVVSAVVRSWRNRGLSKAAEPPSPR